MRAVEPAEVMERIGVPPYYSEERWEKAVEALVKAEPLMDDPHVAIIIACTMLAAACGELGIALGER